MTLKIARDLQLDTLQFLRHLSASVQIVIPHMTAHYNPDPRQKRESFKYPFIDNVMAQG